MEKDTYKLEQILKDPQLFDRINQEFDKKIVGEYNTRKTIFLIACGGRLVENRKSTSGNLLINSESGSGKDHTAKNVLNILPQERNKKTDYTVIKRTRISPKALDHWEIDWTGKILYVEDVQNSVLNSDIVKVTSSNDDLDSIATITNKQNVSEDKLQKGKPIIIFSSAWAYLKNEMLRRFPICKTDESKKQTKEIINKNIQEAKQGTTENYDKDIKEALTLLKRIKVKIPFANQLRDILPTENIITRTAFPRFLDYIKFSTGIHQLQRETDNEGYLLATPQDYDIGRMGFVKTLSNDKIIPLTNKDEKVLEFFRENDHNLKYSVEELVDKLNIPLTRQSLKPLLDNLANNGFLEKELMKVEGKKSFTVYQYKEVKELYIPTWEEIKQQEMDEQIKRLEESQKLWEKEL